MAQFIAMAPKVEVNGQTVLAIVEGMTVSKKKGFAILEKHGIVNPAPAGWYPQQAWLDAFKEIAETIGPNTLYQIGLKIPETAKFPPEIDSLEKALAAIEVAYHMNHRGGEIGHYHFEKTGDRTVKMICPNPYPCDFDKGIIESMARRFRPQGSMVNVKHDAAQPCRKKGGESCTYLIEWS